MLHEEVIVELKAAKAVQEEHEAQLINYLKATQYGSRSAFEFWTETGLKTEIIP